MRTVVPCLVVILSLSLLAEAQRGRGAEDESPAPPPPRFGDGTVNLGPEAGGKGFWGSGSNIIGVGRSVLQTNLTLDEVPFQPWARALYDYRAETNSKDDPHARCYPPGGPRQFQTPNGFEFIQQPDLERIIVVFGGGPHTWRAIYTDGRASPELDEDLIPTYMGYSTARWEGDTLVIDSIGYNEKFWFARGGPPHTEQLHLTERISRPDYNTLHYEVSVDDSGAYTEVWTGGFNVSWTPNNWDGTPGGEIHEYFCQDNNLDAQHLIGN